MESKPTEIVENKPETACGPGEKSLAKALTESVLMQVIVGFMAAITTDGGVLLQFWIFAFFGYWGAAAVILLRRRGLSLTKGDIVFINIGFPVILFILGPLVALSVWRLQGYF